MAHVGTNGYQYYPLHSWYSYTMATQSPAKVTVMLSVLWSKRCETHIRSKKNALYKLTFNSSALHNFPWKILRLHHFMLTGCRRSNPINLFYMAHYLSDMLALHQMGEGACIKRGWHSWQECIIIPLGALYVGFTTHKTQINHSINKSSASLKICNMFKLGKTYHL